METAKNLHEPVLLQEVIEFLKPKAEGIYLDGTLGLGGHTKAILRACRNSCQIVGLEQDVNSLKIAKSNLKNISSKIIFLKGNFNNIEHLLNNQKINQVDGVLLDLGISSYQIESKYFGYALRQDLPLDMRINRNQSEKAGDLINQASYPELVDLIKNVAEERRFARRITQAIIKERQEQPIETTKQLAEIIAKAIPGRFHQKIHPATNVFRALRMQVNRELENLRIALPQIIKLTKSGGRILIISFHSGEDRLVKKYFQQEAKDCLCESDLPICTCQHQAKIKIITRKPIIADEAEILANPKSRSAKLRVAEKI